MTRVLGLVDDPDALRAQLAGRPFDPAWTPRLARGVSTDAIIHGGACTLGTTPDILGPHLFEHFGGVIGVGDVAAGGFEGILAGADYGSGSSREVAIDAHLGAGIRWVAAPSFSRIFAENAVYRGLELVELEEALEALRAGRRPLSKDLPPLFEAIRRAGGLLRFAQGAESPRPKPEPATGGEHGAPPRTAAQKIVDAHRMAAGDQGAIVPCRVGFRGLHEYTAGMVHDLYRAAFQDAPVWAPQEAAAFEDHFSLLGQAPQSVLGPRLGPARRLRGRMVEAADAWGIERTGPGDGICHRLVLERWARPGEIAVLTDSHSPTAGVLGCLGLGVGSAAMACALRFGWLPVTVPYGLSVRVRGRPGPSVTPKDLILHLVGELKDKPWRLSHGPSCVAEFSGAGLDAWSVEELSVLTNMTVEAGLASGLVEPTPAAQAFLAERGRARRWPVADPDAEWLDVIEIDLNRIPLTLAAPGDPGHRTPLEEALGRPVHNVVIASCTGAGLADLEAVVAGLAGRPVAPGTRLTVTPASREVAEAAHAKGLLQALRAAGAVVSTPGCGACIGNGPGVPEPGETTLSTTNRNFERRMGAAGPVWLASPAVAGASAREGKITDPRR